MNWLDIVIVVFVILLTLVGLNGGLIKTALSLAGLIFGVMLATRYSASLAEKLTFIPQTTVAQGIAFTIILIGVALVAGLFAQLLRRATSAVMLGWLDHLGGAIFGLVLGIIIGSALLATWVKFFGATKVISESTLPSILLERFTSLLALLPGELEALRSFFH